MKKFLYGFATIILLIVIIPNFVDWSHYKSFLGREVKEHTGLELDLNGPLYLRLFPTVRLSAKNVSIKNSPAGKAENLMDVKSVSLKANLLSLLRGKLKFDEVVLIEPIICLEVLENGHHNWDLKNRTASIAKQEANPKETPADNQGVNVSLKKVEIKEGKVTFKNFQTGSQQEIKHINLEGSLDSLRGPFAVEGHLEIDGYTLKGDVQTGEIVEEKQVPFKANLSAAKGQENYGMLRVNGTTQGLKFRGDIQSDALKAPFSVTFQNKRIDLQNGIKISAHLEVEPESIHIAQMDVESNSLKMTGNITYASPQLDAHLILTEGASQIDLSAKGKHTDHYLWDGTLIIRSEKPRAFLKWMSVDTSASLLQSRLNISTHFKAQPDVYTFSSLKFKIGDYEGSGTVTVEQRPSHPYVQADLSLNKLDIKTSSGTESQETKVKNKASHGTDHSNPEGSDHWSKDKWTLEPLKVIDTDCKLKVGEITYDNYRLQQVSATLHLKNGNLQLSNLQAQGYGGYFTGNGMVNQGKPSSFKVNFSAQHVNLASIPEVTKTSLKKAMLDTSLTLSALGNNTFEVVNSLSGNGRVNLTQGVVEAFDIKSFVADMKRAKGPAEISLVMTSLNRKSENNFTHLKADFTLKNGQASTSNLEYLSHDMTLHGKGSINLPHWHIDMATQMEIKDKAKLPTIGMKIEGNLGSPSYKVDQDMLVQILLKETSSRLLDKATHGMEGKVGDVVRGVLGVENESGPPKQETSSPQEQKQAPQSPVKIEKVLKGLFGG